MVFLWCVVMFAWQLLDDGVTLQPASGKSFPGPLGSRTHTGRLLPTSPTRGRGQGLGSEEVSSLEKAPQDTRGLPHEGYRVHLEHLGHVLSRG